MITVSTICQVHADDTQKTINQLETELSKFLEKHPAGSKGRINQTLSVSDGPAERFITIPGSLCQLKITRASSGKPKLISIELASSNGPVRDDAPDAAFYVNSGRFEVVDYDFGYNFLLPQKTQIDSNTSHFENNAKKNFSESTILGQLGLTHTAGAITIDDTCGTFATHISYDKKLSENSIEFDFKNNRVQMRMIYRCEPIPAFNKKNIQTITCQF